MSILVDVDKPKHVMCHIDISIVTDVDKPGYATCFPFTSVHHLNCVTCHVDMSMYDDIDVLDCNTCASSKLYANMNQLRATTWFNLEKPSVQ